MVSFILARIGSSGQLIYLGRPVAGRADYDLFARPGVFSLRLAELDRPIVFFLFSFPPPSPPSFFLSFSPLVFPPPHLGWRRVPLVSASVLSFVQSCFSALLQAHRHFHYTIAPPIP